MSVWAGLIATVLGALVKAGLWMWSGFRRREKQQGKNLEAGKDMTGDGYDEKDPSKITAGKNRIRRA